MKTKIIHVISDTNIGGAGRWLINYSKYYDREKYDLSVIVPEGSKLIPFITANGVRVIELKHMADKSFDKKAVKVIKEVLKKEKPQILHTHASLSARIAGRASRVPFIFNTRHCIEPINGGIKGIIKKYINNKYSDYFIAVAESVKENLMAGGVSEDKIRVVANGVERIEEYSDSDKKRIREEYGFSDTDIIAGIMARIEEVKGHSFLIDSFARIENENIRLVVAGTGSLEDEIKEKVHSLGLDERIKFVGYVTNTTGLLNIMDMNVISSSSEAMSLAILEAMSVGVVTVATRVGGNGELIADGVNGYLVDYGNTEEMAKTIEKLADSQTREKLGRRAKEAYETKYRAEISARTLEKCYGEALLNG